MERDGRAPTELPFPGSGRPEEQPMKPSTQRRMLPPLPLAIRVCLLLSLVLPGDHLLRAAAAQESPAPPPNFLVAFIGDQGAGSGARAVLQLIKNEGAAMVLHQGDFDYEDDPDKWTRMLDEILGPDFPLFASIGNHDVDAWPRYQQKLQARVERVAVRPGPVRTIALGGPA